jgi:hypothetical protein
VSSSGSVSQFSKDFHNQNPFFLHPSSSVRISNYLSLILLSKQGRKEERKGLASSYSKQLEPALVLVINKNEINSRGEHQRQIHLFTEAETDIWHVRFFLKDHEEEEEFLPLFTCYFLQQSSLHFTSQASQ